MDIRAEHEAVELTALLRAAEDWSDQYGKDPQSHSKLIKLESRWIVALVKYYRQLSNDIDQYVNWVQYRGQVLADFNVEVIINETAIDDFSDDFIKVSLEFVTDMTAVGALSGDNLYDVKLGLDSNDAIIRKLGTEQVAKLVGRRVMPDGSIVDNPKAEFNISKSMRDDIAQAIKTSLNLGETVDEARARVAKVIKNPKRAERIARTESINAYQAGLTEYGVQSGAVGKQWQTVGANDVCADYERLGPQPFDYLYDGHLDGPAAHPNCRCGRRLIYREEWESLKK